jgi:hypothetical protein
VLIGLLLVGEFAFGRCALLLALLPIALRAAGRLYVGLAERLVAVRVDPLQQLVVVGGGLAGTRILRSACRVLRSFLA